jgi:hypothetical protein
MKNIWVIIIIIGIIGELTSNISIRFNQIPDIVWIIGMILSLMFILSKILIKDPPGSSEY